MQRAVNEHAVNAYSSSKTIQDTVQHASVDTVQHVVTTHQRGPPTGLTPLPPTLLNETAQSGSPILPYPAISAQLVLAALDLGPAPCPHTHTNSVPCQYLLSLASQALTTRFYRVGAPLPGCGFTSACKHSMFVHLPHLLTWLGYNLACYSHLPAMHLCTACMLPLREAQMLPSPTALQPAGRRGQHPTSAQS
jgi:hypothetical protein